MLQFFKYMLATFFGLMLFAAFSFFALFVILAGATAKKEVVVIDNNAVLKLELEGEIREIGRDNPFEELNLPAEFNQDKSTGLVQIKKAIKAAASDPNIRGIYLECAMPQTGYAMLQEIRDDLLDFKKSGKFVYAYGEYFSEAGYYLASVADKIFLNPMGAVEFNGINSEKVYVKNMLDKLGVKPEIFKVGSFKSAVEMFTRSNMSDEDREQTRSYINSIYDVYLSNVATSRNIPKEELANISAKMLVQSPADALNYKLVTDTAYYDQVEEALRKSTGTAAKQKIKWISTGKYLKSINQDNNSANKIAVIVAQGEIVSGDGGRESIGSDKIAAELRKARLDENVKAVVLRINSPGGSALASDVMWREVILTKQAKPIIASMSDVAASGGYYMAMGCSKIVAHPNTITGSIGIFGTLFDASAFFNDKLGVTFDRAATGEFSSIGLPTKSFTESERQKIQMMVNQGYETFTSKAAQGRNMPLDKLKEVASGRVWSGIQAKEVGLVDELGDLDEAIRLAAEAAKVGKDYKVMYYPQAKGFLAELLDVKEFESRQQALREELGPFYPYYQQIQKLKYMQGVQARMPFDLILN